MACWMHENGLQRGDSIGVHCRNSSAVMNIHFAAAALHCVVVNLNVNLASRELEYILLDSGVKLCFVDTGVASSLVEARGNLSGTLDFEMVWVHVEGGLTVADEEARVGF